MGAAACGGNSQSASQQSSAPQASAASSMSASTMAKGNTAVASAADGAKVFDTNCASCHGANGQGLPGAFPPLAKNPTVVGDATKVIHIVKYGLTGAITVEGHPFNGQMPPWGSTLSNADIAAVVTYVRSSWGNKAPGVSEAQVAAVAK
jgi:cbb3-type cytochrome c oxidase subunit III